MKILGKTKITIFLKEANFNKALEMALERAVQDFKIDEDGHSTLKGWDRSCCSVEASFITVRASTGVTGAEYAYHFDGYALKCE